MTRNGSMDLKREGVHRAEAILYSLLAAVALAAVSYLCYFKPVLYARMVNEDQWGEYGTAIGHTVAGVLFLYLAAKRGPFLRRLSWALMSIATLFIAGEELSWGQRILHYSVPGLFHRLNTQDELNLHNFADLDTLLNRSGLLRRTAGSLVLGWSFLSLLVSLASPRLKNRMERIGLPLIPVRLLPVFLLIPYFFMMNPLARSDEMGELFLAVGMAFWAVDLCFRHALPAYPRGGRAVLILSGVFLAGVLLSSALTWKFPGSVKGVLDAMANRYAGRGMYVQADGIYRYIYEHPFLLKPETRIDHARMLLKLGRKEEASEVLKKALDELADGPKPKEHRGEFLRRRGIVHALLKESDKAEADFAEAIALERREAELSRDPDEKAGWLWSVAQTLEARGDYAEAISVARKASEQAASGKVRRKLEEWILFLEDPFAAQAQLEM